MDDYAAGVVRSETDHGTPTFDVIAVVEDWQDANGFSRAGAPMHRLIEAEAAIEKARAVPPKDPYRPGSLGVHYRLGYNDALRDVLRALDGDA